MTTYKQIATFRTGDDTFPTGTLVSEYKPKADRLDAYQTEAQLERLFIDDLQKLGYEYIHIPNKDALLTNLRRQIQRLNGIELTDGEWERLVTSELCNPTATVVDCTARLQRGDTSFAFTRETGETVNLRLLDKKNIHNNALQVMNQYRDADGSQVNRYDVTVLVNGLPLVHIELKKRGVKLRDAFNQIGRYREESFLTEASLFNYVQLFVISNGTHTRYYSNTTRATGKKSKSDLAKSFKFTSTWADVRNTPIEDLVGFTSTFFVKNTILNLLTKYCVFNVKNELMVMRPYQIAATEAIVNRVKRGTYDKSLLSSVAGGGYVWHTTGSGKTLTSFKAAQLIASEMPEVDKVVFVVDRKDLDIQTIQEYERFEKGAANGSNNTNTLKRQLENRDHNGVYHDYRILVTTIQKLSIFVKNNPTHDVYHKRMVLIFDECHRSQFGEMHRLIQKSFKRRQIFGFTGTPIFDVNAKRGGIVQTTESTFGEKLHAYTVVNAIHDENVLPFLVDFVDTIKVKENASDRKVEAINSAAVMHSPERRKLVVSYILEHFNQKTMRHMRLENPSVKGRSEKDERKGFNSIFAVSSIPDAKEYYLEFQRQLRTTTAEPLKVAIIFSAVSRAPVGYGALEAEGALQEENSDDPSALAPEDFQFLERSMNDYNRAFGCNFEPTLEKFAGYYQDVSSRVKNREIDILIVVNMFLTGFDAPTLNTLWVDKQLKYHGLIQAFSRTNRILDSVKTFGNIVCFQNILKETEEAIALFGDENASGIVLMKSFEDYYQGYTETDGTHVPGYCERVNDLVSEFPLGQPIIGKANEKKFIADFGAILKLNNILSVFDEFDEERRILKPIDFQDYTGIYNDLYDKYRPPERVKEPINDDVVFEMELVKSLEVDIDYILVLVERYRTKLLKKDEKAFKAIRTAIDSSPQLRSKRELIEQFVNSVTLQSDIIQDWPKFVREQCDADLEEIIVQERLIEEPAREFVRNAFLDGELKTDGTAIVNIIPKMSMFDPNRAKRKQSVIAKLRAFFDKYFGVSDSFTAR
ncbi:MAG: type I restriction endonuclease subunit R [Planctomycetia bacterium]|nr:type I restriction endonuclease subunit R [Planctomycetia bacterium]